MMGFLTIVSCVTVKKAPKIETFKIEKGNDFSKELPPVPMFVFEDPKDAYDFYDYVNVKYDMRDKEVGFNVPVEITGDTLYLTYYEIERETQKVNILGRVTNEVIKKTLDSDEGLESIARDQRTGTWYIGITARDEMWSSALNESHALSESVINYLEEMRQEYLRTHNYNELRFLKQG